MLSTLLIFLASYLLVYSLSSDIERQARNKRGTTNEIKMVSSLTTNLDEADKGYKKTLEELDTYAQLRKELWGSLPNDFTICSTIFSTNDVEHYPLTLLGNDKDLLIKTYIDNSKFGLVNTSKAGLSIKNYEYYSNSTAVPMIFPGEWVKSCLALSMQTGSIKWVLDGNLVLNVSSDTLKKSAEKAPTDLSGRIIIGATKHLEGWKSTSNEVGSMSVFSSALSEEMMKEKTGVNAGENCKEGGDYLSWEDMDWETHGKIDVQIVDKGNPCTKEPNITLFPSQFAKMSDCMNHCQKLGGRAPKVVSKDQWQELQRFMKINFFGKDDSLQALDGLWLSVSDAEEEGTWKDFYTGETIKYIGPFTGTGPNGGKIENCAIQISEDKWVDGVCNANRYNNFCACSHVKRPHLRLRGLCPDSAVDSLYIPRNNIAGQIQYVSSKGSVISYDDENRLWRLNKTGFEITGSSISSKVSYILGKHDWTIENDTSICGLGQPYTKQLKLSFCREDQFTCNSGQCVRMEDRCDQLADCTDESDEEDCQLLLLRKGYKKNIPPIVRDPKNPKTLATVPVRVFIVLLKIIGIEEVKHSTEIQFRIEMEWYESRATFNNLKENSAMNVLTQQDVERLWHPLVTYANTAQKEMTTLGRQKEWSTRIKVRREGNVTRGGKEVVNEVEVFRGDQNPLVMTQVYTKRFQCQYDFQLYPFDTQTCTIRMDASADDLNIVKLVPNKITMKESLDLTLFKVKSWSLEYIYETSEIEGIWVKMDLQRKVMNELLTTFLPSILLMIITFATTFFKPIWFEAALSVNLTTMLMMTTISIGKMQTLPTTAYIRMIDVWLVFCQLVPFAEVILLTALDCYRDEDDEEVQAQMILLENKKNKPGSGNFIQVVKNYKTSKVDTFKEDEVFGDKNAYGEVSSNKRLQLLKTLGALTIQT